MHQEHERNLLAFSLEIGRQRENILVNLIVHADYHIDIRLILKSLSCCSSGFHPHECRRIRHVQSDIFLVNLGFDFSVLLHNECIIIAAYHQDSLDSELDKRTEMCVPEIFRSWHHLHNHWFSSPNIRKKSLIMILRLGLFPLNLWKNIYL